LILLVPSKVGHKYSERRIEIGPDTDKNRRWHWNTFPRYLYAIIPVALYSMDDL
jgi:hypothetical protein